MYERFRLNVMNAKGIKERITIYGKTPADLNQKIKKRWANPARTADIARLTVESYFRDRFLPGAKPTIRPNTYASYENAVNTRIVPGLGKAKFAMLTPDNVRAWIAEMQEADGGDRSDQLAVAILKRGYKRALEDGLLPFDPIGHVKPPKAVPREQYILNLKEVIKFLRTLRKAGDKQFPLIYCAVSLGMRESELFGLLWSKIANGRAKIDEQAQPQGGVMGQAPLKTGPSVRTLYIDPLTQRALDLQKGLDQSLVFPGPRGGYYLKRTMAATIFPRLLRAGGLPTDGTIWFHLLRHVASSILSSANVSTPKIDKWMGHSVSGIAGKYIKIHDEDLAEVAKTMAGLLSPVWD